MADACRRVAGGWLVFLWHKGYIWPKSAKQGKVVFPLIIITAVPPMIKKIAKSKLQNYVTNILITTGFPPVMRSLQDCFHTASIEVDACVSKNKLPTFMLR